MRILGIDPGRETTAWALVDGSGCYRGGGLTRTKCRTAHGAAMVHERERIMNLETVDHLYIEVPQFDGRMVKWGASAIVPCLDLCFIAGYLAGAWRQEGIETHAVTPREWKGSTPKAVHHRRLLLNFSETCQARIAADLNKYPKSLQHNLLDAVGLAHYGKTKRCQPHR